MSDLWDSCRIFVWGLKKRIWRLKYLKTVTTHPGENSYLALAGATAWKCAARSKSEATGVNFNVPQRNRAWPCSQFPMENSSRAPSALMSVPHMEMLPEMEAQSFRISESLWIAGRHHPKLLHGHAGESSCAPKGGAQEWLWGAVSIHLQGAPRNASLAEHTALNKCQALE